MDRITPKEQRVTREHFCEQVRQVLAQGVALPQVLAAVGTAAVAHFVDEAAADADDQAGLQPW
jgi:hypothetical protein